jgi:flagella basal body P-ring formation protein FlgA
MNKAQTALFSFFISITMSLACEVQGPKFVIFSKEKTTKPSEAFQFKNCSNINVSKLKNFINDFEGTLHTRLVKTETGINAKIKENSKVFELNSFLNLRVDKERDWRFISSTVTAQREELIVVDKEESLNVICDHCTHTGTKNIKIEIRNPIESRYKYTWVQTDLAAKTEALLPTRAIPVNNQALTPKDFVRKIIYHTRPEQFFTQPDQLIFYKVNKPKSKGEAVKFQDLTPVNLVQMGQPATVILKNKGLHLETTAIPGQSGRLGQQIRLKNPRTKKTIIGKVIHFNKVEVEL